MLHKCHKKRVSNDFRITSFIKENRLKVHWPIKDSFNERFSILINTWKISCTNKENIHDRNDPQKLKSKVIYRETWMKKFAVLYAYLTGRETCEYEVWMDNLDKGVQPMGDILVCMSDQLTPGLTQYLSDRELLSNIGFIVGSDDNDLYENIIIKSLYQFLNTTNATNNIAYLPSLDFKAKETNFIKTYSKQTNSNEIIKKNRNIDVFALIAHSDGHDVEFGQNQLLCPYSKLSRTEIKKIKNPLNCITTNQCYRSKMKVEDFLDSKLSVSDELLITKVLFAGICNGFVYKNELIDSKYTFFSQNNKNNILMVTTQAFEPLPVQMVDVLIQNLYSGHTIGRILKSALLNSYLRKLETSLMIFGDPNAHFAQKAKDGFSDIITSQLMPKKYRSIKLNPFDSILNYISSFKDHTTEEIENKSFILENISYTPDTWFLSSSEKNTTVSRVQCHSCNNILLREITFEFKDFTRIVSICSTCGIVGDEDMTERINVDIESNEIDLGFAKGTNAKSWYIVERYQDRASRKVIPIDNKSNTKGLKFKTSSLSRALSIVKITDTTYSIKTIYHRLELCS